MKVFSFRGEVKNPETGEILSLGAGKSSAARFLRDISIADGTPATHVAFADGVKSEVYKFLVPFTRGDIELADALWLVFREEAGVGNLMFPVPELYHRKYPDEIDWVNRHKMELRPLLQWYGTEYRRGFSTHEAWARNERLARLERDDMYWVRQVMAKMTAAVDAGHNVTCDDLRFESEYQAFTSSPVPFVDTLIVSEWGAVKGWLVDRDGRHTLGISKHASEVPLNRRPHYRIENKGSLNDLHEAVRFIYLTEREQPE